MLSKSVEYAIKSLVLIRYENSKIGVEELSKKLAIPKNFTSKILQNLVKRGWIISQKGPGGGFLPIVKKYKVSTIKELIIDIDNNFNYDKCSLGLSNCSDINPCPLHEFYKPIKDKILNEFMNITIDDICKNPQKVLKL